jgi:hypothetical protein
MTRLLTPQTLSMRPVEPALASKVLTRAVDTRARADLRTECDGAEVTCGAVIMGGDESSLTLDVGSAVRALTCTTVIHASIEVDQITYQFETRCTDESSEIAPGMLRVVRPRIINRIERRRSPRRRFEEPTEVVLRPMNGSGEPCGRGKLLNLSPEGLACRVPEAIARELTVGQVLQVAFLVGPSPDVFDLNARVVNITEGGTQGQFVIGLEFVTDDRLEAGGDRLRKTLKAQS